MDMIIYAINLTEFRLIMRLSQSPLFFYSLIGIKRLIKDNSLIVIRSTWSPMILLTNDNSLVSKYG
jgi:hypothetical protein